MSQTQKLYYDDPELRVFDARVEAVEPGDAGAWWVELDRTAFFPTGGGQPHDTGSLGGSTVIDVIERGDAVLHLVRGEMPEGVVGGEVDWTRRLDHREQHTGQHILSRAFVDLHQANTVGFHLGEERCSIDLDRDGLDEDDLFAAESRANEVVLEDAQVTVAWYSEPGHLPATLRKDVLPEGRIRVVSVGGFDSAPCCGTHCLRAGQVGPVKVLRWERKRGGLRVEFVCGTRALRDYRHRHLELRSAALAFTTEEFRVVERITALLSELKSTRSKLAKSEAELRLRVEKDLEDAPAGLLAHVLAPGRVGWLSLLATPVASVRNAPVLVASEEGGDLRICVAVPSGFPVSAGTLLQRLVEPLQGRGGGSAVLAQGSIPIGSRDRLEAAWLGVTSAGQREAAKE